MKHSSKATNASYQEQVWLENYENFKTWKEKNKTAVITEKHVLACTGEDRKLMKKLYNWTKHQRQFYRKGEILPHRARLLDEAGFVWKARKGKKFEEWYEELKAYRKKFKTCHVPQDPGSEWYGLSRFVNDMRVAYEREQLEIDKIRKLEKIGFVWNVIDDRFEQNLKKLKRFHKEHGHFDVPAKGRHKQLGSWVAQLRCRGVGKKRYKKALDDIGFEWHGPRKRMEIARKKLNNVKTTVSFKQPSYKYN